jgi:DNA-binding CsgD family transcriptional regulator
MRGRITGFRLADVRSLLRLCNALHEAPAHGAVRKRRLLEGLCELLEADAATCQVCRSDAGASSAVSTVRWPVSGDDARFVTGARGGGQRRSVAARGGVKGAPLRHTRIDPCIESLAPVAGTALRARVTLLRRPPATRGFTGRDRALLDVFHREMSWLYRPELRPLATDPAGLTPRQRQTLRLLMSGLGEKQIAARLGVSRNTVHHYVKALYRHFNVSTRSELLARWVKE